MKSTSSVPIWVHATISSHVVGIFYTEYNTRLPGNYKFSLRSCFKCASRYTQFRLSATISNGNSTIYYSESNNTIFMNLTSRNKDKKLFWGIVIWNGHNFIVLVKLRCGYILHSTIFMDNRQVQGYYYTNYLLATDHNWLLISLLFNMFFFTCGLMSALRRIGLNKDFTTPLGLL